jgi:hypothetical protein
MTRRPARVGPCPNPVEVRVKGRGLVKIRCKSRRCDECGKLWAGDQNRRLVANLDAYNGPLIMGSLTAPGNDVLATAAQIEVWNEQAAVNWRLLNAEAQKRTRAECGRPAALLAWVWEKQRRGALHKHFALGTATARERHAAHVYLRHMESLRGFFGFGFMDRGKWDQKRQRRSLRELTGLHAGRYMAKYLMKRSSTGDLAVQELVKDRDVPPLVVYVTRRLTSVTGITMRSLRLHRFDVASGALIPLTPALAAAILSQQPPAIRDRYRHLVDAANAPPEGAQPRSG